MAYHVRFVIIVQKQRFELVQNRRFFFDEEDFEKLEETKKRRRSFRLLQIGEIWIGN